MPFGNLTNSTFDPAEDQPITGEWSFDISGGKSFIISDDPTLTSPSLLFGIFDDSLAPDTLYNYSVYSSGDINVGGYWIYDKLNSSSSYVMTCANTLGSAQESIEVNALGASLKSITADTITLTGETLLSQDPTAALGAVTKQYVDLQSIDTLTSSAGVVTVNVSATTTKYTLSLTEDVTSWVFNNLPDSGKYRELYIEITQHASAAKTVVTPATSGRTAGGAWTVSPTLSSRELLILHVFSDGTKALFPTGLQG